MYHLKVLQLVGIKEYKQKLYLQINMQFDQEETFYWNVDQHTATNLLAVTDFTKGYFYRLSLRAYLDKSIVTKTQLEQSLQLEFTCSEEYANQLAMLKQVDSLEKLDELTFLTRKLESSPKQDIVQTTERLPSESPAPTRVKRKSSWLIATAFTVVLAIIFTYTGHSILSNAFAQSEEKVVLEHELDTTTPTDVKGEIELKPETIIPDETITMEEIPDIPFFELEDGTSHGIPTGKVALTFDDGPSQYTEEIIDVLKENDAGGTFFLIGSHINKFPGKVEYIHENDYSIGSHSMSHINFASSGVTAQQAELLQTNDVIKAIIGEDITLFRPPFGQMNDITEQLTTEMGQRIVLWNNDPKDWETRNANSILNHIKSTEVSGSIILLHETKSTLEALPEIIAYLKEQNLELVTLR